MSFDLPDLPNGWSFTSLESCSQKGSITYGIVQPGSQTNGGVPIIRVNNFRDTRIDVSDVMKVTPEIAAKYERTRLKGGEVLLTVVGTVGQVAVAPSTVAGYNVARAVAVIHPLPHVSAEWIALCLRSPYSQYLLGSRANTTVQTTINLKDLRALPIPLPPERERVSITEMVGAIDDRITLLRETNTTLEAIAQALFKSWFVDFDPVHAKMQGLAPKGMDEATTALFPDRFEESELGAVPMGWRIGSVEDLCSTITNGGTPSRSKPVFWDGGSIPWFKTGEFHDGFLLKASEFITSDALNGSSVKLLPKDSVLMAIYAAPTVGRLGILTEPATFNQACTGMVAKAEIGPWFLFWTLFNGRDWFNSRANGAAQQNISKAIVGAYRVVVPGNSLLAAFNNSAQSLHDSIRLNSEKAQTLSALRDTLLPRLISGQLSLSEVAAQNI
jgi:type I restriction enzyme S subunit